MNILVDYISFVRAKVWFDALVSVLIVATPILGVLALIAAAVRFGAASIEPILGLAALLYAFSAQSRSAAWVFAILGGWLIHG